jgi:hypothetical protein
MRDLACVARQVGKLIILREQRASQEVDSMPIDDPTRRSDQHHQQRIDPKRTIYLRCSLANNFSYMQNFLHRGEECLIDLVSLFVAWVVPTLASA